MVSYLFYSIIILFMAISHHKNHILSYLLCLEATVLFIFALLSLFAAPQMHVSLILLCIGACEAAMGLSSLISAVRISGTDSLFV
uniref:NADH dehydrogenase subunit 4L n=1 Tax=Spadella cephaloptera TaxID=52888 RepID=Q5VB15_9BILA|nr:NADH dehydrogenase subunit 4L [Spadella cephaloptera]AAT08478.1 NADH dehydrogenase subunit 4L [Spadella cephaloptera]